MIPTVDLRLPDLPGISLQGLLRISVGQNKVADVIKEGKDANPGYLLGIFRRQRVEEFLDGASPVPSSVENDSLAHGYLLTYTLT